MAGEIQYDYRIDFPNVYFVLSMLFDLVDIFIHFEVVVDIIKLWLGILEVVYMIMDRWYIHISGGRKKNLGKKAPK